MKGGGILLLLCLALLGCAHDPFDLAGYQFGMTERDVTQKLGMEPTSRTSDGQGGQMVTWTLSGSRAVIVDFNDEGALVEVGFRHPK